MCVRRNAQYSNLTEIPIITRMWNSERGLIPLFSFVICSFFDLSKNKILIGNKKLIQKIV